MDWTKGLPLFLNDIVGLGNLFQTFLFRAGVGTLNVFDTPLKMYLEGLGFFEIQW